MSKHVIDDIGTKILYEPSFDHNSTQNRRNQLDNIYMLAVSKRDLKQSATCFRKMHATLDSQTLFPTTFMLRVSLTPWRKRFAVMAGFPLSAPPQQTRGCYCCCYLLDPSLLDPSPLPFKGGFRSLTRFSLHNDILAVCWTPRLCLSKAIFHSLTRFSLHNDILAVGPHLFCCSTPLLCLSKAASYSLTPPG